MSEGFGCNWRRPIAERVNRINNLKNTFLKGYYLSSSSGFNYNIELLYKHKHKSQKIYERENKSTLIDCPHTRL